MAILPLFPLDTVLFPGMQIKLHIFEERYKLMISRCIDAKEPFGVVLIREGQEALGPAATPSAVGCTAVISEVQRLPLENMNIVATGQRRFRIKALDRALPYLTGDVEYFMPAKDEPELISRYAGQLRPLIIRYLNILSSSKDVKFDGDQIPRQPRALGQIASILLHTDNQQKQELLSFTSLSKLLHNLVEIYFLETALLKIRLSPPGNEFDIGLFSSN